MRPALAALLLPLAVGCGRSEPPPSAPASGGAPTTSPPAASAPLVASAAPDAGAPAPSAPKGPDRPFNVLLLLVDSMRADMPWAGYPRAIAPNLTALEKESVSYTRAYSTSSYTAKSVAALLSGKYPTSLKRSGFFFTRYPESNLFFPELLQKAGVRTLSGHAHMYMKPESGLAQGFDSWKVVDGITFDNKTDNHVTSQKLTPLAIELLKTVPKDKRFFMYLHYMDPHDQYLKHDDAPDFGNKARDRYDEEMFYTDLWIGKLLDWCKQQPWWKDTVVIVSADHGEAFGEHKMFRHAFELWNMLTHVPMFARVPGVKGKRIDVPRGHIDLAPTVLELAGVKAEHDFVGKSLVGEIYGSEAPEQRPVLLDLPADSNNPERHALIVGDYKLLVFEGGWRKDLYDLAKDPGETKDLAKEQPEKFKEMVELWDKTWAGVSKVKPYGGNKLIGGGTASGPSN
jgi:arylsulfatase A-like enzyme